MYATIGWGQAVCQIYRGCLLLSVHSQRFHCIITTKRDKEEGAGFKLPTFFSKLYIILAIYGTSKVMAYVHA